MGVVMRCLLFCILLGLLGLHTLAGPCNYCLCTDVNCVACRSASPCNSCWGNHSAAVQAGIFGEGLKPLTPGEWAEHSFVVDNDTEWVTATPGLEDDNDCLQIPAVMINESIFCHGPYPEADFNIVQRPWERGKGSCADRGFNMGPQDSAANVTDQKDMHVCQFTSWDFNHPLPLD